MTTAMHPMRRESHLASVHNYSNEGMRQLLASYRGNKLASIIPDFEFKPGFIYASVRAISARINQNFDGWPSSELKKAYKTFLGKPCFVNHQNFDPSKARGKVVAARYVEAGDDKYIETVMEIDAMRFPKLAREIKEGGMDSVSMGVEAGFTICSYCGNKAVDVPEFCDHVKYHKGSTLQKRTRTGAVEDILVYEKCFKLGFFELSFVFDPADETAVVSRVIAANHRHAGNDDPVGKCQHCGVSIYDRDDGDPHQDAMSHLCWKCVKPHGVKLRQRTAAPGEPAEPPTLNATSPGTDSYADSTEPPKMKNPLGLMGGGSAAAEKFNPVDIGAGLLENMGEHAVHGVASESTSHGVAAPETPKLPEAPSLPESSISKTHSLASLERRIDRLAAEPAPPPNVIILPDMMTPEMPTGIMPQAAHNEFHALDVARFPEHWVPAQRPAPQHKSQGEFDTDTPTGAPGAPKSSPAKGYVTDLGHGYHRQVASIEAAIDLLAYSHVPAKKPAEPKPKDKKKHWYDIFKDDGPHDPYDPRNDPWYMTGSQRRAFGQASDEELAWEDRQDAEDDALHADNDDFGMVPFTKAMGEDVNAIGKGLSKMHMPKWMHHGNKLGYGEVEAPEDDDLRYAQLHEPKASAVLRQEIQRRNLPGVQRGATRNPLPASGLVPELLSESVQGRGLERRGSAAYPSAGSGDSQAAYRHQANYPEQRLRGTEDRQRSGQSGPEQLGLRTRLGHGATPGPQAAAWGGSAPQKQAARRQPLGELGAMGDFSTGGWSGGGLDRLGGYAPPGSSLGSLEESILRLAYGECEAPEDVDTLRDEEDDDNDDFKHYVQSPKELQGPDLDQTKRLDRAQESEGLDADRRAESVEDVSGPPTGGNDMASRNARRARRRTRRQADGPPVDPSMMGGDPSVGGDPSLGGGAPPAGPPVSDEELIQEAEQDLELAEHQDGRNGYVDEDEAEEDEDEGYSDDEDDESEDDEDYEDEGEESEEDSDDLPPWLAEAQGGEEDDSLPPPPDDRQARRRWATDYDTTNDPGFWPNGPGNQGGTGQTMGEWAKENPADVATLKDRGVNIGASRNGNRGVSNQKNRREGVPMSLSQRGRVASSGARRHFRADDSGHTDGGPYGDDSQGTNEEVFLSQTPAAEAVVAPVPGDGTISNTENTLVAKKLQRRIQERNAELRRDLIAYEQITGRRVMGEAVETPDQVDPALSGTDQQDLKGDFESLGEAPTETQPKDASVRAFRAFDNWLQQTTGRTARQHGNPNFIRRSAARFCQASGISVESMFPALGTVLREARRNESSNRRSAMRRYADESLDVAAPQGRIDVEAPVTNTTDADAQASQFDLGDFGNNAGDNVADPELSADSQIWAPGEGEQVKSSNRKADGLTAVRYAEAYIAAGLAPNTAEEKWKIAGLAQTMRHGTIVDRTRLLDAINTQRAASARRTAARGTGRSVPPGFGQRQLTAGSARDAANDLSTDAALFFKG